MKELINIQGALNAPKNQRNNFGNYNYRSCEDILEALKPLLRENSCVINISDEIVLTGERYYVRATATLTNSEGISVSSTAYAREEENKKGMDGSQITGAASSYARKYALNGLFAIDDNKDSDATNKHDRPEKMTNEQLKEIRELLFDTNTDEAAVVQFYKVKALEFADYEKVKAQLTAKKIKIQKETGAA